LRVEDLTTRTLLVPAFLAKVRALTEADLATDFLAVAFEALALALVDSVRAACAGNTMTRLITDVRAQISQFFFQFACATVQPFRLAESVNKKARKINNLRALYQVT
jgi:hypothetical protein